MNGQTNCVEAVRHYLEKIAASSHLNAWLEVYSAEALETAAKLDQQRQNGLPIGNSFVKESVQLKMRALL